MVDVLHYYFEDDLSIPSAEAAEAKSEARSVIYRTLYGSTYKYALPKSKSGRSYSASGDNLPDDGYFGDGELSPFDPSDNNVTKPYIAPTNFNADSPLPFGRDIDAPLG